MVKKDTRVQRDSLFVITQMRPCSLTRLTKHVCLEKHVSVHDIFNVNFAINNCNKNKESFFVSNKCESYGRLTKFN